GTTLDLRLIDDVVDHVDGIGTVLFVGNRFALFNPFVVWHQGTTPLDDADADPEHREGCAEAQQGVLKADEAHVCFVQRQLSDLEVTNKEDDGTDDGQDEQERNLAFSALCGTWILISDTWPVRWQSWVFDSEVTRIGTSALYGARFTGISVALLAHRSDSFTRVMLMMF